MIKVRPFPQSGLDKFKEWFIDEQWEQVYAAETAHQKADIFHKMLIDKLDEIFPEKTRKINSDDQPWISLKLKKLDRKCKRVYHKERKSPKVFQERRKISKSTFLQEHCGRFKAEETRGMVFLSKKDNLI